MAAQRKAAALAKEEAEQAAARMKKKAEWAASDARVQQLYREIDNFSQINERLLSQTARSTPKTSDDPGEANGVSVNHTRSPSADRVCRVFLCHRDKDRPRPLI